MFSSVVHAEFCWICGLFPSTQYARARCWKNFNRVRGMAQQGSYPVNPVGFRSLRVPSPLGVRSSHVDAAVIPCPGHGSAARCQPLWRGARARLVDKAVGRFQQPPHHVGRHKAVDDHVAQPVVVPPWAEAPARLLLGPSQAAARPTARPQPTSARAGTARRGGSGAPCACAGPAHTSIQL